MNISQYLISYPYKLIWRVHKLIRKSYQVDFYCGGYTDYICFKSIHRLKPEIRIVARNRKTQNELASYGIKSVAYPTFPDMVIMARHLARKYPESRIIKIGMRHGAYHFKDFVASHKYNAFDNFMLTSTHEVSLATEKGITNGLAIGFPKIDPMFNGEITTKELAQLKDKLRLDPAKKTILFTATWDRNGYSAVDKWIDRIEELSTDYNVLVTVHQWLSPQKKELLANYQHIRYIKDKDILPYLMISDVMIADISSIIAEFCSLNKPIITFRIAEIKRFTNEISTMLDEISYRIDTFDELRDALLRAIEHPEQHAEKRMYYNRIMFDELDGKASQQAIKVIDELRGEL
ncbi:MAG: CDP-glycerol glycerophosphotransferase family protein [Candidatus Cloacimonetes bacterium]|nr:CDP-glycerol glycerophosphotransferase family protein [Candidatus Cloacimonadota bacterium]